jgi:sterol 3beta-glucosyltransferase
VPIYVGFCSIVIGDPETLTKTVFDAIELVGVRALVSKGWGGLGTQQLPSNVFLVGDVPHDWLFRRVSAVVHHGGARTTAAAMAAGNRVSSCHSLVISSSGELWLRKLVQAQNPFLQNSSL